MSYLPARWMTVIAVIAVIAVLAIPASLAGAQVTPQYVAIDLGTLGGPNAFPDEPAHLISPNGVIVGDANTPAPDPLTVECTSGPGCHVDLAFRWQKGVMTPLGALPGGYFSAAFEKNGNGVVVGISDNGTLDPLTGLPEAHGVIWSDGHITDLGALGGNESWASAINSRGQVAGFAANTIPDPYAQNFCPYPFCAATQLHAFIWQNGQMQDLGTLGGPDSIGGLLNKRGQVAGESFTNATPNPATGLPTLDPFLWEHGHMQDLGTLGGTVGFANWLNNEGEVVGQSNRAGDQTNHPFLWDGSRLVDLGTLGGDNGAATWINDAGAVVGKADLPGPPGSQVHHGFLWTNGPMTDLPPVDGAPCSNAININDRGQVVGNATDCHGNELAAILWEHGVAYDLNTLIAPSALDLITAEYVNERGEILCRALLPNGDNRVVLLVPARLAASEGLTANAPAPGAAGTISPVTPTHQSSTSCGVVPSWQARLARGVHRPCLED